MRNSKILPQKVDSLIKTERYVISSRNEIVINQKTSMLWETPMEIYVGVSHSLENYVNYFCCILLDTKKDFFLLLKDEHFRHTWEPTNPMYNFAL